MFSKDIQQIDLWTSGGGQYDTYRIPALAVTTQGTILAFCEGRKQNRSDTGDIAMLVKRSNDNGITWSDQKIVWDDLGHTCGNPSPVVDATTGTIWLLMTWNRGDDHERDIVKGTSINTRRVFVTSSDDDGVTWTEPQDITDDVKQENWTWYATGPGHGIQMLYGEDAGRLVIPCDHIEAETNKYYSHIIYSDDHGQSWKLGGRSPQDQVNECEVVELVDGKLMLNMRSYAEDKRARQVTISNDGGMTWIEQHIDPQLIEPICQASICSYRQQENIILFANPASTDKRVNMTLRASIDEGETWSEQVTLFEGHSAYSDIAVCADKRIACLYECGNDNPYEYIRFALIDIEKDK